MRYKTLLPLLLATAALAGCGSRTDITRRDEKVDAWVEEQRQQEAARKQRRSTTLPPPPPPSGEPARVPAPAPSSQGESQSEGETETETETAVDDPNGR